MVMGIQGMRKGNWGMMNILDFSLASAQAE